MTENQTSQSSGTTNEETNPSTRRNPFSLTTISESLRSTFGPTFTGFDQRYRQGLLHLNILFIVAIYNFVFFQATEGKEFYVFFPFIVGALAFITQYWNVRTKIRGYLGTSLILLGLLWDLFVSITFIWDPTGGHDFETIPTILLDSIGILVAAFWLGNREQFKLEIEAREEALKNRIKKSNHDMI